VDCRNKQEMLSRIAERTRLLKAGAWVNGWGWNEMNWEDSVLPVRDELDTVTGNHPAIFWRTDMHAAVANSAALRLAGIDETTADPDGGVIGRGPVGQERVAESNRPNGLLWELAINLVSRLMPKPSLSELEQLLATGMGELNRLGITAVHDQRMKDQDEGPIAFRAYQRLEKDRKLRTRISCNLAAHDLPHLLAVGLRSGFGNDFLRFGHIKLFADGSMGSQTAWVLSPYAQSSGDQGGETGVSVTPPDQMAHEIRTATEAGIAASVHAIGDRANREVLDIFEEVSNVASRLPIPHRLEHVQIIDPADIPRLAQNNITASLQPIHALDDMDMADQVLGPRANRTYNFGRLAASGARLALGSDAPVADPNPFLGFHGAICRQRPDRMERGPWYGSETLTLEQTIYGYTMGAAISAGWQAAIGSISPGKRGDMIVLDRDLFKLVDKGIHGDEMADTEVLMTVFNGQMVHQDID
jgi:predicted amidohydrolase YtcJ